MKILQFPHPSLLTPCKPVTVFGEELEIIMDALYDTMLKANGRGLAGNQCGLDMRCFVMLTELGSRVNVINPEIISYSKTIQQFKEGCLSSPGTFVVTNNRPSWVQFKFQDIDGFVHGNVFYGIDAVAFQHELDHLDGKSFLQSKGIPKKKRIELCKKWGLNGK